MYVCNKKMSIRQFFVEIDNPAPFKTFPFLQFLKKKIQNRLCNAVGYSPPTNWSDSRKSIPMTISTMASVTEIDIYLSCRI